MGNRHDIRASMKKKYWYEGSLSSKTRAGEVKRAHQSFHDQRSRCYNKNHPLYRNYGALGFKVEYTSREFIGWWLENSAKKDWKKSVAGRIDHSRGYSFDNIVMQEACENSKESGSRNAHKYRMLNLGTKRPGKKVLIIKNGKKRVFPRVGDAAKFLGCHVSTIRLRSERKPKWMNIEAFEVKCLE